ncbi:major capsid protein [Microviridae sp.]|nr:major capsid protein [Microviridae sp.]
MFGPMGTLPSTLTKDFSRVPKVDIQRSVFNRDHGLKTTFDAGYLVPIFYDEALPGDTFTMDANGFGRLATPINPFMDNLYIETFFFAVPYRLIWNNWEKFCGEQDNPGDSTDYLVPQTSGTITNSTLYDYFGVPTDVSLSFNNLCGRAYNLIYNEWFRDQNLQDSVTVDKGDGPDTLSNYTLLKRGKRHDYFTSALPWPQKGDAVALPLGTTAPIHFDGAIGGENVHVTGPTGAVSLYDTVSGGSRINTNTPTGQELQIYTDLSDATAATINQLREAFQIQRLYEKDARGGTRYTEVIQSHFGVTSPDARLQRPEYLGGGKDRININPIAQTSSTDATTPQGNLSGYGTTGFTGHTFNKSFTEHSVVIGLACVFADLTYQQGLARHFSRQTRWDFYWPALAHLGEQAVLNKEIYAQGTADDNNVFGYQERYAEYRYKPSNVTGQMRSNFAQSLDTWHLAQDFGSLPALNASFIEENPPVDRVTAVQDYPNLILDMYFKLKCARPMPTYGVPGLIDHF